MLVAQFERMPLAGLHSMERLFQALRPAFPPEWSIRVIGCPTPAHSRWWFAWGIWRAFGARGQVNHIVGDVHYLALGLRGSRTILTVHDLHRLDQLTGLRGALYRWIYFTRPLRRCRLVTAISGHTRDRLVEMFPFVAAKIQVVPDCLPAGFEPRPKTFDRERPRILQVGTGPHKNLEGVIEAVAGAACVFEIIGRLTGAQREALERSGIRYENSVDISDAQLARAFERADLVAFVSYREGFGLPILEAQATGRPVITSDRPPMCEVAGVGACTVNPASAAGIRAAFERIRDDEEYRRKLVEAGFRNARRFSAAAVAGEYARLYRQVAGSATRDGTGAADSPP